MTERPLWTAEDELEFQIGDMHGIAFVDVEARKKQPKPKEKPLVLPPVKKQECEKKHITRTGKK